MDEEVSNKNPDHIYGPVKVWCKAFVASLGTAEIYCSLTLHGFFNDPSNAIKSNNKCFLLWQGVCHHIFPFTVLKFSINESLSGNLSDFLN